MINNNSQRKKVVSLLSGKRLEYDEAKTGEDGLREYMPVNVDNHLSLTF